MILDDWTSYPPIAKKYAENVVFMSPSCANSETNPLT